MTQAQLVLQGHDAAMAGKPCDAPTTRERDRAAWEQGWRAGKKALDGWTKQDALRNATAAQHRADKKRGLATLTSRLSKPVTGKLDLSGYQYQRKVELDEGGTITHEDALGLTITDCFGGRTEYLFLGSKVKYTNYVIEVQGVCTYCKAKYWYSFAMGDHNHGACSKSRCRLQSMRDHC